MRLLIFGATGMVGAGALRAALADPRVDVVTAIVRSPTGVSHIKLNEIRHGDFFALEPLRATFAASDACLFCLGVTSAGKSEADYTRLTFDLTLGAARVMAAANPRMTFCYVSGAGTDGTGQGRIMWARVKGRTELALLALPFKAAYMFRPGYIQPVDGIRSKTAWYQAAYTVLAPLYPVISRWAPGVTTTTRLGRALVEAAVAGAPVRILEVRDINALGERHSQVT
jgi:uncharacterized protein YbjT (DUF2867 family)